MPPAKPQPVPEHETLISDTSLIEAAANELVRAAENCGYSQGALFALRLVIEESVSNAIIHGHRDLPRNTPVCLRWTLDDTHICIEVQDQGPGFNPKDLPDPTLDENLEKPSGRGVMLIQAYMTTVQYNDVGNHITMTYKKPATPSD